MAVPLVTMPKQPEPASSALRAASTNRLLLGEVKTAFGAADYTDADLRLPLFDEDVEIADGIPPKVQLLADQVKAADGIVICTPEYNKMIPGVLKNALDWVSRIKDEEAIAVPVYKTRVFALGSASPGALGGIRSLSAIRCVLELGLGALVLPDQIAVPKAHEAFDEHGHLKDKGAQEKFKAIIQRLAHAAKIMRSEPA